MLIILLIAFSIIIVWGNFKEREFMPVFGGFGFVMVFIACFICLGELIFCQTIDEKIEMYQEQNTKIENQVKGTIESYQGFEKRTFKELKPENYISLIATYPELKSDEQVKKQIDLYISNNETITKLKEKKIDLRCFKWWLYFGH